MACPELCQFVGHRLLHLCVHPTLLLSDHFYNCLYTLTSRQYVHYAREIIFCLFHMSTDRKYIRVAKHEAFSRMKGANRLQFSLTQVSRCQEGCEAHLSSYCEAYSQLCYGCEAHSKHSYVTDVGVGALTVSPGR